jgi:hypothetical protein
MRLLDQARRLQGAQVAAHGWWRDLERAGQFSGLVRSRAQQIHNLPPVRVGQSCERGINFS